MPCTVASRRPSRSTGTDWTVSAPKIVTNGGQEFSEGAEVSLDFALSDLYLFHVESKETLCEGIGDPDPDGRDAE